MNTNNEIDMKITPNQKGTNQHFDEYSTIGSSSSMILTNCSSDEENDDQHHLPTFKWKREQILNPIFFNPESLANGSNGLNHLQINRNFTISTNENVLTSFDDELESVSSRRLPPPIPEDKLHRRNPHTVRQELNALDDFPPETESMDIHLNELPGLQNTEQWKRIADRTVHSSPPLSRQYYQTVISTLELQDGQVSQAFGSYRRPGRSGNEPETPSDRRCQWRAPRHRVCLVSFIIVVIIAIVVAVVLAVTIVPKSSTIATVYYEGSVSVRARFDASLLDLSSTLAKNYKKEFCSLIGTTLADAQTKYAIYYSTCTVTGFHNGSIIAGFVLGFTRDQNVTRLNYFLNRTLVNKTLFGGTIISITFNLTLFNPNRTYDNSSYDDYNDDYDIRNTNELIMAEQNSANELQQQQPTHTSYTTVTYTTLEKGLSITISETITITNNNLDKSPINNKNYELILIPSVDNTRTVVAPLVSTNENTLLPPSSPLRPVATTTTNVSPIVSSSQVNLLRTIKPTIDTNFTYIDESSDDRTYSSGDVISTIEDLTTHGSTSTPSTASLNDATLTDSTSTLANTFVFPSTSQTPRAPPPPPPRPASSTRPPVKPKDDSREEKRSYPPRPNVNVVKRQRRMIIPKNQRRLLQYELLPTGKVYYVDRPPYDENKNLKTNQVDKTNAELPTILSRSSSVDTLSEKRHHHQQPNRKHYHDLSLKTKPEQKPSIGGRLASSSNLVPTGPVSTTTTTFKPINSNRKNRFSSFEPTRESLDRVFDVLIAADKRREEQDFWRAKFDHRTPNSRITQNTLGRTHDTTMSNTMPYIRSEQTQLTPKSTLNHVNNRSQSYTTKRTSFYESDNRQSGCLFEDCLRQRAQIIRQPLPPPSPLERNYSPNTIYSTNYPKQQLPPIGKPPLPPSTTVTHVQPSVRILPVSNGRINRAPQARQTSDELSSTSEVWATRSSVEDQSRPLKKSVNRTRFASTVNRSRPAEQKPMNNKRASSVGQPKSNRTQHKNLPTTKSRFFDLFKFTR